MSSHLLWKHSSVFEIFGVDFMLDDNFGLWLIEVNGSPQFLGTNPAKEKIMIKLISELLEIQYAYLRSKVKRLLAVLRKISRYSDAPQEFDMEVAKEEFSKANKNFLEPELQLRGNMSWYKIFDENIPGKGAYMEYLEDECILDR
jgi:hypothetical protein